MTKTLWRPDFLFSNSLLIRNLSCRKPQWYQWSEYGEYKLTYRTCFYFHCLDFLGFQKPFWIWRFPLSVHQVLEVSRATLCDCVVLVPVWVSDVPHQFSLSSVNGMLLWACISMNVCSLHRGHTQCSGTSESRHRFQAAALRTLPSGFAHFVPMMLSGEDTWFHQVPSRKVRVGCEIPMAWLKYSVIKQRSSTPRTADCEVWCSEGLVKKGLEKGDFREV